jgi:hydrogenase nickel incorporation protein HypA/HybF
MHELSIALSIVDVAVEEVERQGGGGRVAAVHVKIGTLCGVVPDALASAFALAREGTPLDRADLVFENVPAVAYCSSCDFGYDPGPIPNFRCPTCGAPTPNLKQGRELEVTALEIDS